MFSTYGKIVRQMSRVSSQQWGTYQWRLIFFCLKDTLLPPTAVNQSRELRVMIDKEGPLLLVQHL
jgi:hypothetical protein